VIPLWRPILASVVSVAVLLPLDRRFRLLPEQMTRGPLAVLTALVSCYVLFAVPLLVPVALLTIVAVARQPKSQLPSGVGPRAPLPAIAAALVVFLLAMLVNRESTPCFWDAFVWLAKARYAAGGLGRLVGEGLRTTRPPFIPAGYPLFEPLSVAVLAGFSSRPASVVAGAIGLETVALVLFLCAIADDPQTSVPMRSRKLATVTLVLLTSPLVLVHLRSAYVDLPLGLLVGALATLLPRPGTGAACAIVGVAAAALKDEGMVHVAAISLTGALFGLTNRRDDALVRRSLACGIAAATVTAAWHLRLHTSGITNADHALSLPDWRRILPLGGAGLAHMLDFRSWGALWVLGAGAVAAASIKPSAVPRQATWLAMLLSLDVAALFCALLTTPGRVMEFTTGGTLLNRLGMQLAPCAALLVAAWIGALPEEAQLG
jgi:hypothetical protein